jgi:hypothetical protein
MAVMTTLPAIASAQPANEPAEPTPPPPSAEPAPPATTPPPSTAPPSEEAANHENHEKEEKEQGGDRRLGGHVLLFPAYVSSSVVASYIGVRARLGVQSVSGLPSPVGNLDIKAVTLSEGLDLGIKITDWLGLFAVGGARSLVSTNIEGLVYQGATYDLGGLGGLVWRLFRSDATGTQLSIRGSVGYTRGQVATLYPLFSTPIGSVADLLQRNLGDELKTPFDTFSYAGGLAFAQGLTRLFGVQASLGVGGSSLTTSPFDGLRRTRDSITVTDITYSLGVAPSIDFMAVKIPVAVMPEYVLQRTASSAQIQGSGTFDTLHQLIAGVYYSGRTNLQLGLVGEVTLGARPLQSPQGESAAPKHYAGELILRYVW